MARLHPTAPGLTSNPGSPGGLAALLLPSSTSFPTAAALSLVFGSSQAALWSLTTPILVDLQGVAGVTTAFGLVTLARGVAMLGLPLGGAIVDYTGLFQATARLHYLQCTFTV